MKKILTTALCLCMLLSLVACGSQEGKPTATKAADAPSFRVGYARVDITPQSPTGLAGYGNVDERKHTEVLDNIYLTCVAATDTEDNTLLLFSADLCSISDVTAASLRTKISNATGVPCENMMFTATHTHSAPRAEGIAVIMNKAVVEAAEAALEDRKPATMFVGKENTNGINFVRHYVMNDQSVVTDNHGSTKDKTYLGHTTKVDQEMRVLQFKREGGKDVVLVNWQSHPHITGGSEKTSLSADIIGAFRTELEASADCLFAYYQGGAGNINPTSRIAAENMNTTKDWKVHGQMLSSTAQKALKNMTQIETGPIKVYSEIYSCATNKEDMNKAKDSADVRAYYEAGHTIAETAEYGLENYGIHSIYHANAIANRSGLGDELKFEISALSIGEFGWALAPYEMFDASAKDIRDASPFAFTFVTGYSNGSNGYIPTLECWEYGAYEADTCNVARGSAEKLVDRFLEMLNELHAG